MEYFSLAYAKNQLQRTLNKRFEHLGNGLGSITGLSFTGITILFAITGCSSSSTAPEAINSSEFVEIGGVRTIEVDGTVISSLPEAGPVIDARKSELGRLLFWDPVLSGDQDVACATCHLPSNGYGDGLARSIGVGGVGRGTERVQGNVDKVPRNAQSILNVAWNGINEVGVFDTQRAPMFWDNRAASLQEQALEPLKSDLEMRGTRFSEEEIIPELLNRLNNIAEYRQLFAEAFGRQQISEKELADALASFQSTIVANNSPFDRWMRGESDAMSEREVSGMQEFVTAGCAKCHSGPMFSDFELHILGTPEAEGLLEPDSGDGNFAFRTPTLRQLDFTAPYFHGGQRETLESVIEFYDEPSRSLNASVSTADLDRDFISLPETDGEVGDLLLEFLGALNDPVFDRTIPDKVPSGLVPGGR